MYFFKKLEGLPRIFSYIFFTLRGFDLHLACFDNKWWSALINISFKKGCDVVVETSEGVFCFKSEVYL